MIKQFEEFLKNTEINQNITNDIVQTFRNLRVLSVNIVNLFTKSRDLTTYHIYSGKFDIEKINMNFTVDKGYLVKVIIDSFLFR